MTSLTQLHANLMATQQPIQPSSGCSHAASRGPETPQLILMDEVGPTSVQLPVGQPESSFVVVELALVVTKLASRFWGPLVQHRCAARRHATVLTVPPRANDDRGTDDDFGQLRAPPVFGGDPGVTCLSVSLRCTSALSPCAESRTHAQ